MQGDNEEVPRRRSRKDLGKRAYQAVFRAGAVLLCCAVLFASGFLLGLYRSGIARPAVGSNPSEGIVTTYNVPASSETQAPSEPAPASGPETTSQPVAAPPTAEQLLSTLKWPADGRIVREPGWVFFEGAKEWTYLPGVDIQVEQGSPVRAAMRGKVKSVSEDALLGTLVVVAHEGGLETAYGRMASAVVAPGSDVSQGDALGTGGKEPLYFKIARDGEPLNPMDYLTTAK